MMLFKCVFWLVLVEFVEVVIVQLDWIDDLVYVFDWVVQGEKLGLFDLLDVLVGVFVWFYGVIDVCDQVFLECFVGFFMYGSEVMVVVFWVIGDIWDVDYQV